MATLNIGISEAAVPLDGPVRVLVANGKIQRGYESAFSPEEWARRLAPREITTDWFPARLSPVSASAGIAPFPEPSAAGKRKRANAWRQRRTKSS